MKIILIRKEFDSADGSIVSPIFEDGAMISFPFPSNDADTYAEKRCAGGAYNHHTEHIVVAN